MHWDGHNPVPPEMWLLPDWLPFHPGRLWCHCRMVYLPMCYLYGTKFTYAHADSDPTTVTKQHEAAPSKTRLSKPLLGRMPASNTPPRRTYAHRARYNMLHHVLPFARSHRAALPYYFFESHAPTTSNPIAQPLPHSPRPPPYRLKLSLRHELYPEDGVAYEARPWDASRHWVATIDNYSPVHPAMAAVQTLLRRTWETGGGWFLRTARAAGLRYAPHPPPPPIRRGRAAGDACHACKMRLRLRLAC
jgi:hypothetical protein